MKDAQWIAELVCHGLIQPSFVPPKPLRALRELLRYRRKLIEGQSAERNRMQKLETANLKLPSVATDVLGVSGRAMLRALIEGTSSRAHQGRLPQGQILPPQGATRRHARSPCHRPQDTGAACHLLFRRVECRDRGEAYLDQRDQTRIAANLQRGLERLGYVVSLQPKVSAA
jgi:Transposase